MAGPLCRQLSGAAAPAWLELALTLTLVFLPSAAPAPSASAAFAPYHRHRGRGRSPVRPTHPAHAAPAPASAADEDDDDRGPGASTSAGAERAMPTPFFASILDKSSSEASAATTTVTTRLPLGTLFDSRDYIFTAASNVRGYEWDAKQVDELFEDLSDVSVGAAAVNAADADASAAAGPGRYGDSPNRHRDDYELSQIVLVPQEWDRAKHGLGARYDVHDGQQRLITICLLLAALRESFRADAQDEAAAVQGAQETVEELTAMLNPPKVRKAPVLRIELRERDNEMLRRILTPEVVLAEWSDGSVTQVLDVPDPGGGSGGGPEVSPTNRRVLANYHRLAGRVAELDVDQRLAMLDYIIEHVYLLVCVPETATIARNIVMSQGKGMDTEPIDDFKGLVCFRYTQGETEMYDTFDAWDDLASPPDFEAGAVGRSTVSDACLLRAAATLRAKVRKNDQAYALEDWLRQDLIRNRREGGDFYLAQVEPASRALYAYRTGALDSFGFSGRRDRVLVGSIQARLSFLRELTSGVASTKELEAVVLDILLRAEGKADHKPLNLQKIDDYLACAEVGALWMSMLRPSPTQRNQRCFDLIGAIDAGSVVDVVDGFVSDEEKATVRNEMSDYHFGASPSGRKIAAALLQRLNSQLARESGENARYGDAASQHFLEHVLPTNTYRKQWRDVWPEEKDREDWTNRIGNLAVVTQKPTAKERHNLFSEKKSRYKKEAAAPLTRALGEERTWDVDTLKDNHGKILGLVARTWVLS